MLSITMKRFFAVLSVAVLLTGCSAQARPAAKPKPKASYATVVELRDAFVKAGGACPNWVEGDQVTLAAQSGTCSDTAVLSVYLTRSAVLQMAETQKSGGFPVTLLVGQNWAINTPHPERYAGKLGGTVVTTN